LKKNQLKQKTEEKEKTPRQLNLGSKFKFDFSDPNKSQVFGLFLVLVSAFLTVAIFSYFFTWKEDQSQLQHSFFDYYFNREISVDNWLGKFGAAIAHFFVHKLFGIASLVFPYLLFLIGTKVIFGNFLVSFKKSFKVCLFLILWLSPTLAFFSSPETLVFGGGFGFQVSSYLISIAGSIGTGLLIFFIFLAFTLSTFNLQLKVLAEKIIAKFSKPLTGEPISAAPNEKHEEQLDSTEDEFDAFGSTDNEIKTDEDPSEAPETPLEDEDEFEIVKIDDKPKQNISEPEFEVVTATEEPSIEDTNNDDFETISVEPKATAKTSSADEEMELEIEKGAEEEELSESEIESKAKEFGDYDPKLDLSQYQFPTLDLLEDHGSSKEKNQVTADELEANKRKIVETLNNYGIGVAKIKATIGPTITLYEMVPEAGVRISKIKNLEDDIALSIAALGIRIIAPIPGKGTIGIEVPNSKPEIVPMRGLIASDKFQNSEMELPLAIGKTIGNETYVADLAKMPHLLMAGATGQGKSVGLNAILTSLLYKKHPSQVKFVLVDPKKVELTLFNKVERHFLAKLPDSDEPIITDTQKVIHTLNSLCIEMDTRYELLKEANVRNIKEYNAKFIKRKLNPENGHKYLPYIVVVIDEFADLIMTAGKEVETPIARLAQLARAIGIHLIIATQRPSVNIITGTIKANFPARIAFRVSAKIDSRTILDTQGADQLIGRGDMLISNGNDLVRVQCGFVDTPEVEKICEFIGDQRGYASAFHLPEFIDENAQDGPGLDDEDRDDLFEDAARVVVIHQQGSASLLQRKLKLGFNRAGRIIDQLEAAGIIGPFKGSKAREVLYADEQSLEQFLNSNR
jgi:S-DNA-T family DNA segregation ATPase FtsK/SpoIIIE